MDFNHIKKNIRDKLKKRSNKDDSIKPNSV